MTRAAVFRLKGKRCALALPCCTGYATHVHHTMGVRTGHDLRFLVPACAACNLATGDPTKAGPDPAPTPRTRW